MIDQTDELKAMIQGTAAAYRDRPPPERMAALQAVRWRLRSEDGRYACCEFNAAKGELKPVLRGPAHAYTFDGRDNEDLKRRFYEINLGEKLHIEVEPEQGWNP